MLDLTPPIPSDPSVLVDLMRGRRCAVLAGAGCSTESGIPDYRGPEGSMRARTPVQYGDFVRSSGARARYWARSAVGWERMCSARPNPGHTALARLEAGGVVVGVITQNVDGLHHMAGSRRVVELHGSLAQVCCLTCGGRLPREALQRRMLDENATWIQRVTSESNGGGAEAAPDGDAELAPDSYAAFITPNCSTCGGILKPDVVFFGENVPRERVIEAWSLLEEGELLLVVGSSLTVYSGRRFIYRAVERDMPIAVANLGPTRADDVAAVKIEGRLGEIMPRVADALL